MCAHVCANKLHINEDLWASIPPPPHILIVYWRIIHNDNRAIHILGFRAGRDACAGGRTSANISLITYNMQLWGPALRQTSHRRVRVCVWVWVWITACTMLPFDARCMQNRCIRQCAKAGALYTIHLFMLHTSWCGAVPASMFCGRQCARPHGGRHIIKLHRSNARTPQTLSLSHTGRRWWCWWWHV